MHGFNIDGLDFIFPRLDLFEDIVGLDLFIFNDATELDHLHTESDGDQLVFLIPDQTFRVDFSDDLLGQSVQVLFFFEDLDVEDDDGLGNSLLLLTISSFLGSDGFESLLFS